MKEKHKRAYMNSAHEFADCSSAVRLKVGAVIVNDDNLVFGYNGTPSGWDNTCEDLIWMDEDPSGATCGGWLSVPEIEEAWPLTDENGRRYKLVTKPEVLHAESNAISKLAKSPISGEGATMFMTHSPCIECAKLIHQAGIKEVYFAQHYRQDDGIDFLKRANIVCELYTGHKED
jgi:dCMP deaminase